MNSCVPTSSERRWRTDLILRAPGLSNDGGMPSHIDPGLCGDCRYARIMLSDKGSVFYRCLRALEDTRYPKYPRLPVLVCAGYEARERPNQPSRHT